MLVGGFTGFAVLKFEGKRLWNTINRQLDSDEVPASAILESYLIILATLLLMMPGLLTGLLGVFFLIPLTRAFVVSYLILRLESSRFHSRSRDSNSGGAPGVIDID
ncbi:hypothetical protein FACS189419_04640 [Planctomycetales bacterium]|nr:hypothetical protein FACS189419_04640 [Planctomycetales bacterium]